MKSENKVLLWSLLFGLLFWIVDAILDSAIFYRESGTFLEILILDPPSHELYIRTVFLLLFFTFGLIAAGAIRKRRRLSERIEHLNRVLSGITQAQHVIHQEKDRNALLQKICDTLIETGGYRQALIALMNSEKQITTFVQAGFGDAAMQLSQVVEQGMIPECFKTVRNQNVSLFINNPADFCAGCPVREVIGDHLALSGPLSYDGVLRGALTVILDKRGLYSRREKMVFQQLADLISFALHNLETEEKSRHTQQLLHATQQDAVEHLAELNLIYQKAPVGLAYLDQDLRFIRVNDTLAALDGMSKGSHIGKHIRGVFPRVNEDLEILLRRVVDTNQPLLDMEIHTIAEQIDKQRFFLIGIHPIQENDGRTNIIMVVQDISQRKQAERQHAEVQEKYRMLFEASADGVFLMGDRYIDVNESVCRILNRTREEIINHPPEDFSPQYQPDGRLSGESALIRIHAALAGRPQYFYWQHMRKDGQYIDTEIALNSLNIGGQVMLQGTMRDITERKQAELALRESEARYRTFYDSLLEGTASMDMEGKIQNCNSAFERMTGYTSHELYGKSYNELTPAKWHERELESLHEEALVKGVTDLYEKEFMRKDGTVFPVEMRVYLMRNRLGEPAGMWKMVRDITERKRAEAYIKHLNEKLEQRVQQRTAELTELNNELEAFSYSVSHDLRAPLRSIDGFSQVLINEYAARLDEKGIDYLNRVCAATRRMAQLIDDLLRLSRLSRSEMRQSHVDLAELARDIMADLRSNEPGRIVDFRIQEPLFATGDPTLLRVLLLNLLDNAWKFTRNREHGRIELGVCEENKRRIYYVRDNGVGFDMAYADKLFGAFQRLHHAADFPGTGIGLATVRRIINRMGGRVWADSQIDHGSTFFFSLSDDEH